MRRSYLIVMPMPLPRCALKVLHRDARGAVHVLDRVAQAAPAAPLVVGRRYLIVAASLLDAGTWPYCPIDDRGAAQVLDRGSQGVSRCAARCASQILGCGAQALARGVARCA
jgi:hypothetical protein